MIDRRVVIGTQILEASTHNVDEMRDRLLHVPASEKADIAYRASSMIRRAHADGRLRRPLAGDLEDAVAMLLVLGVRVVHQ